MKPPKFIERVLDSTVSVLGAVDRSAIVEHLSDASISLRAEEGLGEADQAGFLLAANLAARLYPAIRIEAPSHLAKAAESEMLAINPRCQIEREPGETTATLSYGCPAREEDGIAVFARAWNVYVDLEPDSEEPAHVPAAMLAATLGLGEAFRTLFASQLGDRGRDRPNPFGFNMITLGDPSAETPWPQELDLGRFNLAGCGAVGQAAALTLSASGASGTLVAIDDEEITLSNLQRYVLARESDVGKVKVKLLKKRLSSGSLEVVEQRSKWSVSQATKGVPSLVALDTAEGRIGLQAALPGPVYNAWTQPADVGVSRHERFGEEPCLACMHWPDRPQPSRYEQVADAFRQHPARCLAYLVHRNIPVGAPLPPGAIQTLAGVANPPDGGAHWAQRPILDDIAAAAGVQPSELDAWRDRSLADLYQEGVCGGAVLDLGIGEAPREALVPLAHQSAFAGILLATQLIAASVPQLRNARPEQIEARYDLLAGGPQHLPRPRALTPGCICSDAVYREVYLAKFPAPKDGEKR